MNRLSLLVVVLAAIPLTGCITYTNVKPYTGKEKGQRYALVEPYLLVTPKADGGVEYEWLHLPNTDRQFAISTVSIFSSYKYDTKFANGTLTSVDGNADASAVATQFMTEAGTVFEDQAKDEKAEAKTARDQAEADKKANQTKIDAAEKAVADANLQLAKDNAVLEVYNRPDFAANVTNEKRLEATLKVEQSNIAVKEAERVLNALKSAGGSGAADVGSPAGAAFPTAPGPVLFRVVQGIDAGTKAPTVELVAVSFTSGVSQPQIDFETVAALPGGQAAVADEITFTVATPTAAAGKTSVVLTGKTAVKPPPVAKAQLNDKDGKVVDAQIMITQGGKDSELIMTISPSLKAGKYNVQLPYLVGSTNKPASTTLELTVP